jgi:hypothetical protein
MILANYIEGASRADVFGVTCVLHHSKVPFV